MKHYIISSIVLSAAALVSAPAAHAWNHTGHRTTALIAWQNMTPAARSAAARFLRAHPRLQEDLLREMPQGYADPDLWAFMTAAIWPDIIRNTKNPMHTEHHKGPWHYIDLPYAPDGNLRQYPAQPTPAPWKPGDEPQHVFHAIPKATADLADAQRSDADRSVSLCWYLHLAGDLHQPLHSTSIVNDDFPLGDRIGTRAFVRGRAGNPLNLHAFWDQRLGTYRDPEQLLAGADRATTDHPLAQFGDDALPVSPEQIAHESRALAVPYVYLHGNLKCAPGTGEDRTTRPATSSIPPVPPRLRRIHPRRLPPPHRPGRLPHGRRTQPTPRPLLLPARRYPALFPRLRTPLPSQRGLTGGEARVHDSPRSRGYPRPSKPLPPLPVRRETIGVRVRRGHLCRTETRPSFPHAGFGAECTHAATTRIPLDPRVHRAEPPGPHIPN